VRGCAAPLERRGRAFACARGHAFDLARSGYVNLLQPHERRASEPGDSAAAVRARRALLDGGFGTALEEALAACAARAALPARARAADLGCGEGTFVLAALARRFDLVAFGVDLSRAAIDAAARRHPAHTWIVANADRRLPFQDASLDLVLSIDGRGGADEIARVLAPGGALLVAVGAADDLAELRRAVLGEARATDRAARVIADYASRYELVERVEARSRHRLDAEALAQLAAATYRFGRRSERAALEQIDGLEVTTSHDVLRFRASVTGRRNERS
jgi:23S rRNA (guanine745-N1)-methyltransferase